MDLIFTNNDLEKVFFQHFNLWDYLIPLKDIQMNNYALLSLACLIISYKFTENDPKIPSILSVPFISTSLNPLILTLSKRECSFKIKKFMIVYPLHSEFQKYYKYILQMHLIHHYLSL